MSDAGLKEAQVRIKIAGRNINNLADDTTLMAESEEELKSLLMKVKEESEKAGLKLNIQKMKIMASGPITSWEIDGETVETLSDFIFGGSKITADGECSHEIKRCLLLGRKVITNLNSILKSRDITLPTKVNCSTPGFLVHHQLPEFTQTHIHRVRMPSSLLILCRPLLLLPSIFLSIRVFSNESVLCIRWPKYWSFSFKISPTNEQSGLISFRMDWLDLLAVQGTLKSLL